MNPNVPPQVYQPQPQQFYQGANPAVGHPMMLFLGNSQGALWFAGVLWFVTWLLIIAILVALLRLLWRKGEEVKKR